ncbi:MAG: nucleotidyltransferase domain-containing protein [Spirochaetaceae bacterium]|nr:nucleotidyltransferase domain-containing protein [Spirochaetaceae bacterium]
MDEERMRFLRGVAEGLKQRERRRSAHLDHMRREWRAAGLAEADRLTKCFVEADPDLRKVVLFGSLATGDLGNREPDVDLAVDSPQYLRLVSIALDSPFKVDVVDLPNASPVISRAVERDGRVMYERESARCNIDR